MCYCNHCRSYSLFKAALAVSGPRFSGFDGLLALRCRLASRIWAHSCPCFHQIMTRHPQVGQRKQRGNLRPILRQSPVAGLHVSELALDHPKRMLHLGANARLELFGLVQQFSHLTCVLEHFALTRAHGDMPGDVGVSALALFNTLVPGISPDSFLLSVQQPMCLSDITDVATGATHRVHQSGICIHANMGFHPKVPLVALLAGVHLGVASLVSVFDGTRCGNQGGVHCTAFFEHQAALSQYGIDFSQNFDCKAVFLQPVAQPQDGALAKPQVSIGQAHVVIPADELAVQRGVEEGFFHGRVRQVEPLLQEVSAQHRLQRKRWPTGATFGVVRGYEVNQLGPRNDAVHLVKKDRFAGFAHRQRKTERSLTRNRFHAMYFKASRPYSTMDSTCIL